MTDGRVSPGATAVVFGAADAARFLADRPKAARVLPLTAPARCALAAAGLRLEQPQAVFSDRGHARCAARGRRVERQLAAALQAELALSSAAVVVLRQYLVKYAYIAERARASLAGAPPFLWPEAEGWREIPDRATVLGLIVGRIVASEDPLPAPGAAQACPTFYRLTRAAIVALIGRRGRWAVASPGKLRFGLDRALAEVEGGGLCALVPPRPGIRDYRLLFRGLGGRRAFLPLTDAAGVERRAEVRAAADRVLGNLRDPVLAAAIAELRPYLLRRIELLDGWAADAEAVLRRLRPAAALSAEANAPMTAMLFAAARAAAVPCIVVNHNSHGAEAGGIAGAVIDGLVARRIANDTVDAAYVWSPPSLRIATRIASGHRKPLLKPLSVAPAAAGARRGGERFLILHAGNFQSWLDFFPWVAETSEEYLDGIAALAREIAGRDGFELHIRVRNKPECPPDLVDGCLPRAPNVRLTGTQEDFLAQLAGADLLAGHFSTTVEQALQNRVPVLLWGSPRYRQFKPRLTPPRPGDRAAVYAVPPGIAAGPMLDAIRACHQGRPLTDDEIAGHVWPGGTPGVGHLAEKLLAAGAAAPPSAERGAARYGA